MKTLPIVVDFDEFKQLTAGLSTRLEAGMGDKLGFEGAEEALHRGIVKAVAFAADADLNTMLRQQGAVIMAGILATPVGVMEKSALELVPAQSKITALIGPR